MVVVALTVTEFEPLDDTDKLTLGGLISSRVYILDCSADAVNPFESVTTTFKSYHKLAIKPVYVHEADVDVVDLVQVEYNELSR